MHKAHLPNFFISFHPELPRKKTSPTKGYVELGGIQGAALSVTGQVPKGCSIRVKTISRPQDLATVAFESQFGVTEKVSHFQWREVDSNSGSANYELFNTGQIFQPLLSCLHIYKMRMMIIFQEPTSQVSVRIKYNVNSLLLKKINQTNEEWFRTDNEKTLSPNSGQKGRGLLGQNVVYFIVFSHPIKSFCLIFLLKERFIGGRVFSKMKMM